MPKMACSRRWGAAGIPGSWHYGIAGEIQIKCQPSGVTGFGLKGERKEMGYFRLYRTSQLYAQNVVFKVAGSGVTTRKKAVYRIFFLERRQCTLKMGCLGFWRSTPWRTVNRGFVLLGAATARQKWSF